MTIRPFVPEQDMQKVISLYTACFSEPPWYERFDEKELEEEFIEIFQWPESKFLVGLNEQGKIIGGAIGFHVCRKHDVYERLDHVDRNSFYISELFVHAPVRVRGVCRQLNRLLLDHALLNGYVRASVRTSVAQPAIVHIFVDRLGFHVVNQQDVVSTKWIDAEEVQAPDTRIIMTGTIPVS